MKQLITDLKKAKADGHTYKTIAAAAEVHGTTISQILRGKITSVRIDTYQKLRSVLDAL